MTEFYTHVHYSGDEDETWGLVELPEENLDGFERCGFSVSKMIEMLEEARELGWDDQCDLYIKKDMPLTVSEEDYDGMVLCLAPCIHEDDDG